MAIILSGNKYGLKLQKLTWDVWCHEGTDYPFEVRPRTTFYNLIKALNTNVVGAYLMPLNRSVGTIKWYLSVVLISVMIWLLEQQASSNWSKLLWHPCVMLHTKCMHGDNVAVCFLTPASPTNKVEIFLYVAILSVVAMIQYREPLISRLIPEHQHSWGEDNLWLKVVCGLVVRLIRVCTPWWAVIYRQVFALSFIHHILVAEDAVYDMVNSLTYRPCVMCPVSMFAVCHYFTLWWFSHFIWF